jgi:antitoxin (DNA-binding transcriptional repressor) of toxin-antitoxin stability system
MSSALSSHAHVTVVTPSGETVEAPCVYTMTELNQQTARVLEEINASGRPAVITRHGRFVAMVSPLAAGQVETAALSRGPLAAELRRRQAADAGSALSADELESRMDGWT